MTLGNADFMRVPLPAASTMAAMVELFAETIENMPETPSSGRGKTVPHPRPARKVKQVTLHIDRTASGVNLEAVKHRFPVGDVITETGETLMIAIPIRLKTWGGETVIEGPNGTPANAASHLD